MFSYRHGFHAGNHADVLKHLVLVQILNYYNQKDAPYWFIDLHAGAGLYDLQSQWAQTKGEFLEGISRVWTQKSPPKLIAAYTDVIKGLNNDGELRNYPGSPWIAQHMMRRVDKLRLFELHPNEVEVLRMNLAAHGNNIPRQTAVFDSDGFKGLKAQLPPPTRRAVVLIDPSYEDKQDYRHVITALKDAIQRFPTGCYIVWYPLVLRREVQELARQLERIEAKTWVHVSLTVKKPSPDGLGLHGSGVFIINPPYTLNDDLAQAMPWLLKALGQDDRAVYKIDQKTS